MSMLLLGVGGAAAGVPALTLTATTTGAAETVTIHRMTPATGKSLTIDWGDGNSTVVAAGVTAAQANTYASAGTYNVRVTNALDIVQINLQDAKLSGLKSAELAGAAITYFVCYSITNTTPGRFDSADVSAWTPTTFQMHSMPSGYAGTFDSADVSAWGPSSFNLSAMPTGYAGTFDSADVSAWNPGTFILYSMPAGYAGTFNSADVSAWNPGTFYLYSMPAGYAGTFNSADVSAWNPVTFSLNTMPVATFTIGITDNYSGWAGCNSFLMQDNGLLQADVDTILWSLYQASLSRVATGGTINLGGSNAAPSGTYQAAAVPPVSAATPGKEVAHELQYDGCDAIAAGKTWTTVTITA